MRWWRALRPSRAEALAALAAAGLFALAFPPIPLIVPVAFCLVPLAVAIARRADGEQTAGGAARVGFWFGIAAYGTTLYFIAFALSLYTKLAILGYFASVCVMAGQTAAGGAALHAARRTTRLPMAVLLPPVWTTVELLNTYVPDLAFPWLPLGLALTPMPAMIQASELSGVHGLSFVLAAMNGLLADAWLARDRPRAVWSRVAIAAALPLALWAYGAARMPGVEAQLRPVADIAVVQPNIPQQDKWQEENRDSIVTRLGRLTREVARRGEAKLIVWPEVALPGFLVEHPEWRDTLRAIAADRPVPLVFGVLDVEYTSATTYEYYNAAMLADSVGQVGSQPPYRKGHLVPVVERVPFLNPRWFSGFKYFGGFGAGHDPRPFVLGFGEVGVLICYESVFPARSRTLRALGTDVLLNITNDAWFGRTVAPYQHNAHLSLRAIENRVSVVRSANTGISGYIDPLGRTIDATPLFVETARSYAATTTDLVTPFMRFGDWVGIVSSLATLALVLRYAVQVRARRRAPPPVAG